MRQINRHDKSSGLFCTASTDFAQQPSPKAILRCRIHRILPAQTFYNPTTTAHRTRRRSPPEKADDRLPPRHGRSSSLGSSFSWHPAHHPHRRRPHPRKAQAVRHHHPRRPHLQRPPRPPRRTHPRPPRLRPQRRQRRRPVPNQSSSPPTTHLTPSLSAPTKKSSTKPPPSNSSKSPIHS